VAEEEAEEAEEAEEEEEEEKAETEGTKRAKTAQIELTSGRVEAPARRSKVSCKLSPYRPPPSPLPSPLTTFGNATAHASFTRWSAHHASVQNIRAISTASGGVPPLLPTSSSRTTHVIASPNPLAINTPASKSASSWLKGPKIELRAKLVSVSSHFSFRR